MRKLTFPSVLPDTTGFDRPADRTLTRALKQAIVGILCFVVLAFPFRSVIIGTVPGFFTIYGLVMATGFGLSGAFLTWWAKRSSGNVAILAATYVSAAVIVLLNVILILEPVQTPEIVQTSASLWGFRHIVLPLGILLFLCCRSVFAASLRGAIIGALVVTLFVVAFVGLGSGLFHLIQINGPVPTLYFVGGISGIIASIALWRLLTQKELTSLHLVLIFVLATTMCELILTLASPFRVSLGAYASRVLGMASGMGVVVIFFRWLIDAMDRSEMLQHYITIAESSPNVTFLADEKGRAVYVNERWNELTGQQTNDALGIGFSQCIHPDDLARRFSSDWFTTEDNHIRFRARDGSYVWHLVRYQPLQDRTGRFRGWVGTATNLDRERRALDESRRLAGELRRQFDGEREISEALRAAFLPRFLPETKQIHFSAIYRPFAEADQVGGDWYDAFVLPSGITAFTMGDVSGHGLASATSMLRIREGLRMAALTERSPGATLGLVNRMLTATSDILASALVAFIDGATGRLQLAVAGHPPPIVIHGDEARKLSASGIVLGVSPDATFDDVILTLAAGDRIAFYTDGLIECDRRPIEGEQRLTEALRNFAPEHLSRLVDSLLAQGQNDDATIVLLSYQPAEPFITWRVPMLAEESAALARGTS